MSFEEAMQELVSLVSRPDFKEKQVSFFAKHCMEFDESTEENKLAYTAVHKEYERFIEQDIEHVLGPAKLQLLCAGAEEYVKSKRSGQVEPWAEAFDLLASLADYEAFKAAMLAKKQELHAKPVHLEDVKGVLNVAEVIDHCSELKDVASEASGWSIAVDELGMVLHTKTSADGAMYLRYAVSVPLSVEQASDMFVNWTPASAQWRERMKNIRVLRDYGPNDQVVQYEPDMPWAIRYIMSLPTTMCLRICSRANWPATNDFAYACLPFDPERNVCLEEMGPLKVKTGVISPDLANPEQCTLHGTDKVNMSMMPSWGMRILFKKFMPSQLAAMTVAYKKAKGLLP